MTHCHLLVRRQLYSSRIRTIFYILNVFNPGQNHVRYCVFRGTVTPEHIFNPRFLSIISFPGINLTQSSEKNTSVALSVFFFQCFILEGLLALSSNIQYYMIINLAKDRKCPYKSKFGKNNSKHQFTNLKKSPKQSI